MAHLNQFKSISERLEQFRAMLQLSQMQDLARKGYNLSNHDYTCRIKIGRKYANVDVGTSGKYMVELTTGKIYGIKGYGVIHRGHYYGTLDTIDGYDWSGYTATPRKENQP